MVTPVPAAQRDVFTGGALSDRSRVTAGLLQVFLGSVGAGRFYTGHVRWALLTVALTALGTWMLWRGYGSYVTTAVGLATIVDGILMLSGRVRDARGRVLRP